MRFDKCALLCAILALSILDPIAARKGFGSSRHTYPKSGGLSGGGSHGYPSSGGLSGGGSHGYPSSGGHSSAGGHGYPPSGGSHGYPSSGGLSGSGGKGYPSSGGSHTYPSSNSHGYPASGGLSGNNNHGYPKSPSTGTSNVHHHYHYSPPQQIHYTPTRGGPPVSYPVYQGTPPTYVYKYKDSGSKYGTLLTGLALLNLGTLAAGTAYAVSHSHGSSGGSSGYKPAPGEVCKFGLKKANGDYEETRIDCQLITSFIFAEQSKTQGAQQNNTTITTVTTVTNVTMVNNTNAAVPAAPVNQTATKVLYEMLSNGTLVPVNASVDNSTTTAAPSDASASANNPTSSVVTTVTNTTTVVNALDVKGKPVNVTPDMECFVIRTTPNSRMRKSVPCQLLQTYADKSIKPNSGVKTVPTVALLTAVVALFILN